MHEYVLITDKLNNNINVCPKFLHRNLFFPCVSQHMCQIHHRKHPIVGEKLTGHESFYIMLHLAASANFNNFLLNRVCAATGTLNSGYACTCGL